MSGSSDENMRSGPFPFAPDEDNDVFSSVDLDVAPVEAESGSRRDPGPSTNKKTQPNRAVQTETRTVASLSVRRPDGQSVSVPVHGPRFVIGRGHADLIVEDEFVSPWHAQLYVDDGKLVLEDMNSFNGVFLRIADELTLEDRDELVIGQQRFVFRKKWEEPRTADRPDRSVPKLGAPVAGSPVRLLRWIEGGRLAGVFPIRDRLTIGTEGCDVACPEDLALSNQHAEIVRDDDVFQLRDLDSEFGTFIRIHDSVELVDGDCFLVGRTRLDLSYD